MRGHLRLEIFPSRLEVLENSNFPLSVDNLVHRSRLLEPSRPPRLSVEGPPARNRLNYIPPPARQSSSVLPETLESARFTDHTPKALSRRVFRLLLCCLLLTARKASTSNVPYNSVLCAFNHKPIPRRARVTSAFHKSEIVGYVKRAFYCWCQEGRSFSGGD